MNNNIFETYLRRLTSLSANSRSLLLLRLVADQLIDLNDFSQLRKEPAFEILRTVVAGTDQPLCQVIDPRMEANNSVSKKLKQLDRFENFLYEERGVKDLHVAWPFVRGKFLNGTPVRAPFLFFPVKIEAVQNQWWLRIRKDAPVTINKSLLLAYAHYNELRPEEDLFNLDFDEVDREMTGFRSFLYELMKHRLEINFTPELFEDRLTPFQLFKRSEYEDEQSDGQLKLCSEAVLGIFPQAGSQLVPDYMQLIAQGRSGDLEDFFSQKAPGVPPSEIKEEQVLTPFSMDAYQEHAIKKVKQGYSIVVQGPPGTGKSQMICNLIADAIGNGKKILLVCQKRAALDVVYTRLQELGLRNYLGLIHDFQDDRKEIYAKIAEQINGIEEIKSKNRSVDVIQAERRYYQVSRRIDQITEELEELRESLFNDETCGWSAKQLYLSSSPHHESVNLPTFSFFNAERSEAFISKLKAYCRFAQFLEDPLHPWFYRKSFSAYTTDAEQKVLSCIQAVNIYNQKLGEGAFRLLGIRLSVLEGENVLSRRESAGEMLNGLDDAQTYEFFQAMVEESDHATSHLWLSNMERVILNCFVDPGPEVSIPSDKLGEFQHALHERMQSRRNIFSLVRWELFSPSKFLIKRALVNNGLAYSKYGLRMLERKIDNRLNLEHHLTAVKNIKWLIEFPGSYDKEEIKDWFAAQKRAVTCKLLFRSFREVRDAINPRSLSLTDFKKIWQQLFELLEGIPTHRAAWEQYLTAYQIRNIFGSPTFSQELESALIKDFDNLCAFDRLKERMQNEEREVIERLYDHIKEWDSEKLIPLFNNSIRLSWINHLETKFPHLRMVSTYDIYALDKELQELIDEKKDLSFEIVQVRAREKIYDNLEYNRLNHLTTYRELLHQVQKRKRIWPLRKLIEQFKEELFRLTPCWMASPESVSAIFPMEQIFDIVIFDEASQCFAEQGIPAMYRGRQVVVSGDRQQLRPSEIYRVRYDEGADHPDAEVESLLELGERYLPSVHLQGHYRSKSIELIAFSNKHFYQNKLRMLPDLDHLNKGEPALEYHRVNGTWKDRQNEKEAEAVVEFVMHLLAAHPDKGVGVVTFNAPQQQLLLDLFEHESQTRSQPLPPGLFVKNIENVQGDERDIIVFSIGYAPDIHGNFAMNFGSLNLQGGENRLNVAITRAREKVVVFSSIDPGDLNTEHLQHGGAKLLKEYLSFVKEVSTDQHASHQSHGSGAQLPATLAFQLVQWGADRLKNHSFIEGYLPSGDLSIRNGTRFTGIILTDDERYKNDISVKESHAYTHQLMKRKGWPFKVVYSRNFWKDLAAVESELLLLAGQPNQ